MKKKGKTNKAQRGMALLMTLLVTAVLSTIVVEANYDANVNMDIALNYSAKMRAVYIAKAGIKFANLYLAADVSKLAGEEMAQIEPLLHGLPIPVGSGAVRVSLESEEQKININLLVTSQKHRELFLNLLENLELEYDIYYSLIDWLDKDDDISEGEGAEADYYASLESPYPCKNAPLDSFEELRLIKGVDDEAFRALKKYCTIFSNGRININKAPKEVLLALSKELTENAVDEIIEQREEEEYYDIKQLEYLGDVYKKIMGLITVKGAYYKITSVGIVGEQPIRYKIVNYVQQKSGSTILLYSKEE